MSKIYVESQFDPDNKVVRLSASTGYGADTHTVTVPASNNVEAARITREFINMYQESGARVIT